MVSFEIDINKFRGIGVYSGDDGKEYLIMVETGSDKDLEKTREKVILRDMALRKIDVKGHLYIPDKESHERLREEWK